MNTMPRPTKRAKKFTAMNVAAAARKEELRQERRLEEQRIARQGERELEVGEFWGKMELHPEIMNRRGRSRTYEENCILIFAISAFMRLWIELTSHQVWCVLDWSWSLFDKLVGEAMRMKKEHVRMLRTHFSEHGEVLIFGDGFDKEEFELHYATGAAVKIE